MSYFTISANNLLQCLETSAFKVSCLHSSCSCLHLVSLVLTLANISALGPQDQSFGHLTTLVLYPIHLITLYLANSYYGVSKSHATTWASHCFQLILKFLLAALENGNKSIVTKPGQQLPGDREGW